MYHVKSGSKQSLLFFENHVHYYSCYWALFSLDDLFFPYWRFFGVWWFLMRPRWRICIFCYLLFLRYLYTTRYPPHLLIPHNHPTIKNTNILSNGPPMLHSLSKKHREYAGWWKAGKRCNIWLESFNHPFNAKAETRDGAWQPANVCQLRRLAAPPLFKLQSKRDNQ
jgi:hypothetical protein